MKILFENLGCYMCNIHNRTIKKLLGLFFEIELELEHNTSGVALIIGRFRFRFRFGNSLMKA